MRAAETIMTKDKQNCLPKTSKDIQTNSRMMKKTTQKKDVLQTSPAFSFFTSSSDVTEVKEFKRRCLRNRERNKKFEKEFAIQKKNILDNPKKKFVSKKNRKQKNKYTDCPTRSPISFDSSKIIQDPIPESSGNDTLSINNTEQDNMIPKESSLGKTKKIKPKVANRKELISSVRDDKEHIVEKIVGHKKIKGKYTFEVKWQNCTEMSWEDKSYLDTFICDDVNTYLQKLKNKTTDKKKKNESCRDYND